MICKNCNQNVTGNFCSNCGQNTKVKRINFKYLLQEIPNSIFQMDRGFLFTIKELFIRPGHAIREFIIGQRKQHYKPIAFLLITSTVYVLTSFILDKNTFLDDMIFGYKNGIEDSSKPHDLTILNWISKNQAYIPLLFLPLFSFASFLAFFKSKYNYFEHLVLNLYITGQQMLIYIFLGLFFFKENIFLITPLIVGMIYNFWAFKQFFKEKRTLRILVFFTTTYILFIILLLIVISVLTAIVLLRQNRL